MRENGDKMKSFKKLFEILDKWKYLYLVSGVFLIISIAFRMLEPRVIQLAVDKVIVFFVSNGKDTPPGDVISGFFYSFLPQLKIENLPTILVYLGLMFLIIALLRGATMFASSAISASSTEKAVKRLKDRLFIHIQRLSMDYHSKTPTGELI